MWCDHLFSQRNMRTERAMGLGDGGDRGWAGRQNLKSGGWLPI